MPNPTPDTTAPLRTTVYALLIVTCLAITIGHICALRSPLRGTPMLSANDRSRWATIRALVEHGTYAIDDVVFTAHPYTMHNRDREWYTIDMVRHPGPDGQEHYYSSKPPLLATLLAGEYWLIRSITGATLAEQPFYVIRAMLIINNVLPLALYFALLAQLVERYGRTDWGRLFVMAAAVYGTFLTTFAVTLNNHLPAAISVAIAISASLMIWNHDRPRLAYFALAGFFAAFAVANELPALSFAALLGTVLLWKSPRSTGLAFVPAALVVVVAACLTNCVAHRSWTPPYAHRGNGPLLGTVPGKWDTQLDSGQIPDALRDELSAVRIELSPKPIGESLLPRWIPGNWIPGKLSAIPLELSPQTVVRRRTTETGWVLWDPTRQVRLALAADQDTLRVYAWDHWYEYEGSYWSGNQKAGVDRGEPSRAVYAFQVLLGHHGVFSLTPLWLLSVWGLGIWLARREPGPRGAAVCLLLLTVVCLAFYISRPLMDRNYGGVTCGFRWVFWLTPLWLLALLPAADAIAARRAWRWVALTLLAISVFSAAYPALNPWSQPWLYQYWDSLGWLP